MSQNKIVLIDGHSIIHRAFYGIPELNNSEGIPTNAVYGFLTILFKILDEENPSHLAVAFDVHAPTFRHEMFEEYKGTRKPMPDDLRPQVPLLKELLTAMNITILEKAGFEADDVLGTLGRQGEEDGYQVTIVSGDRDLLQLATDTVLIRIPKTRRGATTVEDYYAKDVVNAYGVTPTEFIDMKALMGDTSDNIPGVPGIGEKTAASLIQNYHSIENVYENIAQVMPKRAAKSLEGSYELAKISKELATINVNVPLSVSLDSFAMKPFMTKEAYQLMKRLEFKTLLNRFETTNLENEEQSNESHLLTEKSDAESVLKKALEAAETGLILYTQEDKALALSVCFEAGTSYVMLVGEAIEEDYIIDAARKICQNQHATYVLDLKSMLPFTKGSVKDQVMDISIAAYLLNPLKSTYLYDDLARDYLGQTLPSYQDLLGKAQISAAIKDQKDVFVRVAGYMAGTALSAFKPVMSQLKETQMESLYYDIEMPLVYSLYHMEEEGICVTKEELNIYGSKLGVRIKELEQEIYEETGEVFNINSPKQLGDVLFGKMNMPHAKKTKSGFSTAADILEKLAPDYPVVDKILEYRQLAKLKSTYADGLVTFIGTDGRIHSTFNQTVTATGRLSSTEPNLQNIPIRMELGREIRKVFVAKEGYMLVDADYSQIELRVLAHMSADERLIEAYRLAEDIHAITASQVFHIPLDEVTPLQRRNAKAVNFGIVYGISAFGLSEGLSITRTEALTYIDQYFETYPKVKLFLDGLISKAKENGYAATMFGRRRPLPELNSSNFMQRSFGERVAMNAPIQGTAADIIKIAMIRVDNRLRQEGLESRLILQVHDELVVEAKEDEVERVKTIIEEEMRGAAKMEVALEVDIHVGKSWYEAK